jgi:hypothetical protein
MGGSLWAAFFLSPFPDLSGVDRSGSMVLLAHPNMDNKYPK